ncbi:hypothetical protein [Sulfuricurvum sp.]|uniref:hypothetical protein n=1 Tax=Sulfuricurvum sp. TaxID=2025608 RepID=UPI00262973BD|nr:hypothetical protein [Sulfuricurvum sp.]MDD3597026.1 hypothetical protein [Sulfuricurvum sp.]
MSLNYKIVSPITVLSASLLFISGCAEHSIQINPQLYQEDERRVFIPCAITYNGDKEYFPSALRASESAKCKADYLYTVKNVNTNTEEKGFLYYINPLSLADLMIDDNATVVEGKLTLDDGSGDPKTFSSSCTASEKLSLYHFGESSTPEQACLKAVRDNIDAQLVQYKQAKK